MIDNLTKTAPEKIYRCPMCGYTHKDALIHMDHAICVRKGGPEMPEISDEELERLSCEIMAEQYK